MEARDVELKVERVPERANGGYGFAMWNGISVFVHVSNFVRDQRPTAIVVGMRLRADIVKVERGLQAMSARPSRAASTASSRRSRP